LDETIDNKRKRTELGVGYIVSGSKSFIPIANLSLVSNSIPLWIEAFLLLSAASFSISLAVGGRRERFVTDPFVETSVVPVVAFLAPPDAEDDEELFRFPVGGALDARLFRDAGEVGAMVKQQTLQSISTLFTYSNDRDGKKESKNNSAWLSYKIRWQKLTREKTRNELTDYERYS
jgi:hypothetical protein